MQVGFDLNTGTIQTAARKAEQVFNETRTATEKLNLKLKELNQLHQMGAIDTDTHTRAVANARASVEQNATSYDKFKNSIGGAWNQLKGFVGLYAGVQGVQAIGQMADDMTVLDGQIRRTTESESEFNQVQKQLIGIATETRASLESTVSLYSRSAIALKEYGYNNQEVLKFTELTNKAMTIGGAKAGEQSAALYQLSQALASGKLAGDEFKSMAENSPVFLNVLAKSLGKTRGELREMASDGKITTDVIMKAISGQSESIDAQFKKMPLTIGGAINQVKTSMMSFLDTTLVQSGAMQVLANAIGSVGEHLGTIIGVAVTAGAAFMSNVLVGAVAASGGLMGMATAAMSASRALLVAAFSNPFTAIVAAVGLAATALYEFRDASITVGDTQTTIGDMAQDVWGAIQSTVSETATIIQDVVTGAINAILDIFGMPEVQWAQVWNGIVSVTSAVASSIYDLTFGLVTNIVRGFESMGSRVKGIIAAIVASASAAVDAVKSVADSVTNLDFSGAYNKIKNFKSDVGKAGADAYNGVQKVGFEFASTSFGKTVDGVRAQRGLDTTRESRRGAGGGGASIPKAHAGGGGGGSKAKKGGGGKGSETSHMSEYEAELTAQQRAYESANELREMSKADEIAYWEAKKAIVKAGSKDAAAIQKKLDQLTFEQTKQGLKNQLEIAKLEAEYKQKTDLEAVADKIENAQYLNSIGEISAKEMLAIEREAENERFKILNDGINARIELMKKDPTKNAVEIAKAQNEVLDLNRDHEKKLTHITRAETTQRGKLWDSVMGSMESLWDKGVEAMMNGTLTFKNAFRAIVADLGKTFAKFGATMLKNWIKTQAQKLLVKRATATKEGVIDQATQASEKGGFIDTLKTFVMTQLQKLGIFSSVETTRQGIEMVGATQSKATAITTAGTEVGAKSVSAGVGALTALSSIPIVGPALGLAAMVAVMGAGMALMSRIPSARGGYDIPAGMNPLTQLHEKEMVLPAKHADVIRQISNGDVGGASGGASQHVAVTYNDHSGKLSPQDIDRNSKHIARAVKKEIRNFNLKLA